jgi:predicted Mrr-cat superfamily restriction endonuclease
MIPLKQGMKLSAMIDKMELKLPDISKGQDQFGVELVFEIISKAHKAEKEVYAFVAEVKGCTQKEAQDVDLFEFISDLLGDVETRDFLFSAAGSQAQE